MTDRDRLVRKYCLLLDRDRDPKPMEWPWAYRWGLSKAIAHVRERIDLARIAERKAA